MEEASKIKSINWVTHILFPIIILSVISGIIAITLGELSFRYIFVVIMIFAALLHIIFLFRMSNPVYFIPLGFYLFAALTFIFIMIHSKLVLVFAIIAGIFFILFMYALHNRKLKWRYREVLELAARSVSEEKNGFTHRPFHYGNKRYSKTELLAFSKFLLKYGIAYPYYEKSRLVLTIPDNLILHLLNLKKNYVGETYLSFDYRGDISIKISEKDYIKYKANLTFDQLCRSFGNLFVDFFSLFRSKNGDKILIKMNTLKFIA